MTSAHVGRTLVEPESLLGHPSGIRSKPLEVSFSFAGTPSMLCSATGGESGRNILCGPSLARQSQAEVGYYSSTGDLSASRPQIQVGAHYKTLVIGCTIDTQPEV